MYECVKNISTDPKIHLQSKAFSFDALNKKSFLENLLEKRNYLTFSPGSGWGFFASFVFTAVFFFFFLHHRPRKIIVGCPTFFQIFFSATFPPFNQIWLAIVPFLEKWKHICANQKKEFFFSYQG